MDTEIRSELADSVRRLVAEKQALLSICDMFFHGGYDERDRASSYKVYNEIKFGSYKVEDNV